jgi:hypothetical protein
VNIFSFTAEFESEESCRTHFKLERDKIGVPCRRCSSTSHYWIKSQWSYECKKCKSRTSLRSGTLMQSSNLSFMIWYKTMFLLTITKKGFSSKEIQRQLGLKRYEPVWAMVHKLRKIMVSRDNRHTLEGMVEMDEGYFTIEASENIHKTQKAECGSKKKTNANVMVISKSTILEDIETGKIKRQFPYFNVKVLENHLADGTDQILKNTIDKDKTIEFADKSTSYVNFANYVELHISEKSNEKITKESRKWVHITVGNNERNFVETNLKHKKKYLPLYLNEFVYKLNQRYFAEKIFDRVVIANIIGI